MGNNSTRKLSEAEQAKLESGKPVYLEDGVKITFNQ